MASSCHIPYCSVWIQIHPDHGCEHDCIQMFFFRYVCSCEKSADKKETFRSPLPRSAIRFNASAHTIKVYGVAFCQYIKNLVCKTKLDSFGLRFRPLGSRPLSSFAQRKLLRLIHWTNVMGPQRVVYHYSLNVCRFVWASPNKSPYETAGLSSQRRFEYFPFRKIGRTQGRSCIVLLMPTNLAGGRQRPRRGGVVGAVLNKELTHQSVSLAKTPRTCFEHCNVLFTSLFIFMVVMVRAVVYKCWSMEHGTWNNICVTANSGAEKISPIFLFRSEGENVLVVYLNWDRFAAKRGTRCQWVSQGGSETDEGAEQEQQNKKRRPFFPFALQSIIELMVWGRTCVGAGGRTSLQESSAFIVWAGPECLHRICVRTMVYKNK